MRKNISVFILVLLAFQNTHAQTNIFPSSGNVGIGTNNSASKLQISGSETYGAILCLTTTGMGGGDCSLISTKSGWTTGPHNLLFSFGYPSSANSKVIYTNTGRVDIGTLFPQ